MLSTPFCSLSLLFTLLDTVCSFLLSAHAVFSFLLARCLHFVVVGQQTQMIITEPAKQYNASPKSLSGAVYAFLLSTMLSTVLCFLPMFLNFQMDLAAVYNRLQLKAEMIKRGQE